LSKERYGVPLNFRKLFQRLLLVFTCFMLTLSICSCNDQNSNSYKKNVDIPVEGEATSIYALSEEMQKIAYEYDEGGVLTYATAIFEGDEELASRKGSLYYTFCRNDTENERGITVILEYDMKEQKVVKVSYENSRGSFTEEAQEPIPESIAAMRFDDIFDKVLVQDSKFYDKLQKGTNIKLTLDFNAEDGLKASLI
jgi:hypothetical protein